MTFRRQKILKLLCGAAALAFVFLSFNCRADSVVLHLRNGDRIAGIILSETTNQVTLSNIWTKQLVIPVSEIERRESLTNAAAANTHMPPRPAAKTNAPPAATNTWPAARPAYPLVSVPPPPPPRLPWYMRWKGEVLVGTTVIRGATDTELFYGKAAFTYSQPYLSDPKEFFRNVFTYVADYGKTDGLLSANDMSGSSKMDFDLSPRNYVYNLGAVGYDEIRSINLHYEDGPGGAIISSNKRTSPPTWNWARIIRWTNNRTIPPLEVFFTGWLKILPGRSPRE